MNRHNGAVQAESTRSGVGNVFNVMSKQLLAQILRWWRSSCVVHKRGRHDDPGCDCIAVERIWSISSASGEKAALVPVLFRRVTCDS
ncbi:hypothetical protein PHSY_000376 [Pseudozyma hubeiensis SY62]|uniref:Uncharacterized protein n=1 Tax=Pseudozyma hubeiensis (strain SY62) TaxID=1305764 RepID=R9P433_PSEHS|nr:hypothetical protein PHSY_000376 [Pseudozyma hubeiensis SY62]GAC92820.1 hypothetical protein PHSY_000376 [Pseudozyma hubeiensis SY62]